MQFREKTIENETQLIYAWFQAMFTRIDLIFYDKIDRTDLKDLAFEIESEILRIEKISNRFDENSELSNLNEYAFSNEIVVSDELFGIISECIKYNRQTLGYFDITVNSKNNLDSGIDFIELNLRNKSVRYLHPDLMIDLSGFIKGYALRKVVDLLASTKLENALINIGNSSIYAKGNHMNGKGWLLKIPNSDENYELNNESFTTSGNSLKTKWPIQNPLIKHKPKTGKSISIVTDDPAEGEVLSIAAYLASPEKMKVLEMNFKCKILN